MSIIKDQYELKEKNTAIFVACLKKTSIYENNGKITFVNNETLNELINRFVFEKKFIEANELIKTVKNIDNKDQITAEITSKSFRLPFETYCKLLLISKRNDDSIGDSLKKIIIPNLHSTIDELKMVLDIERKKVGELTSLLDDWEKRESVKRDFRTSIDLSNYIYEMDENARKYLQKVLYHASSKLDLDPQIVDMFIDLHTLKYTHFIKYMFCNFNVNNGKLLCSLIGSFSYGVDDERDSITHDIFDKDARETFNESYVTTFFNEIIYPLCEFDDMLLGAYELNFDNGTVYVNGINILDKSSLEKMVYMKLASGYASYYYLNNSSKISYDISLLPSDFNEDIYSQQLQEAVVDNDYEKASKISEILEIHQILTKLSLQICDVFSGIVKETRVITITIPNALISLFDLTRDDKSAKIFISDEVDKFWEYMKEME